MTFGPEIRLRLLSACGSGDTVAPTRPGSNSPDTALFTESMDRPDDNSEQQCSVCSRFLSKCMFDYGGDDGDDALPSADAAAESGASLFGVFSVPPLASSTHAGPKQEVKPRPSCEGRPSSLSSLGKFDSGPAGVTFGPEIRLQLLSACGSGETVAPAHPGSVPRRARH